MERRDTFIDQIWKSRHKNVVMYPGPHSNFMTRFEAKGWPLGSGSALGMERDDSDGDSSGYIPNSPTNQSRHRCYTHEEAETHCPKALTGPEPGLSTGLAMARRLVWPRPQSWGTRPQGGTGLAQKHTAACLPQICWKFHSKPAGSPQWRRTRRQPCVRGQVGTMKLEKILQSQRGR